MAQMIQGRYEILGELGVGGMGKVYRGRDSKSGQLVAIKQLKPELVEPQVIERFKREGEALRTLNHPNIVQMLDAVEENDNYYLIMNYLAGGDLKTRLEKQPLAVMQVVEMALDIADALTRAHRLNIIHRDLKPANVLIAEDGTPRLSDFGIARFNQKVRLTQTNSIVGTLDYLAPETLQANISDERTDIWSFGVMLFEMLTGLRPFTGETAGQIVTQIISQSVPDLEELAPDTPIALVDLIYRMLEKEPMDRIPTMRQVGAALESILQGRSVDLPPSSTQHKNSLIKQHNLPVQTTPFVGREQEMAKLQALLRDPQVRLVTVMAQGGMGKTRLAIETGFQLLGDFANGVFMVELAPLNDPEMILSTTAEAISYPLQPDGRDPLVQLLDYLAEKSMLLIFDNFEHLVAGAGLVGKILSNAPQVKILVTSRHRINQSSEVMFQLEGMAFPQWETPDDALEYGAVKLFLQNARRVRPDFELGQGDLSAVARICKLVVGTPLLLLLATAWLNVLSLEEIATEIERSLDFLETDMGDVPERQRSSRAVFDYSWNLLTPAEQQAFASLAIFRGGFMRESAQVITGVSLMVLMSLVNKSLIRRDSNTGRYSIHELLRQYATVKLQELGQEESLRQAHAQYFAKFTADQELLIKGQNQLVGLDTVEADFENVQGAWAYAIEHSNLELIGQMLEGVYWFCQFRNRLESSHLFNGARARWKTPNDPITWRLHVRFMAGTQDPLIIWEQALEAAKQRQDLHEVAFLLQQVGVTRAHHRYIASGIDDLKTSIELYQELGDSFYRAQVLDDIGWAHEIIGQDEAVRVTVVSESIDLRRSIGDRIGLANALRNLATAEWLMYGIQAKSLELLDQSREITRENRDRLGYAWSTILKAAVLFGRGRFDEMEELHAEAEMMSHDLRHPVLSQLTAVQKAQLWSIRDNVDAARKLVDVVFTIDKIEEYDAAVVTFGAMVRLILCCDTTNVLEIKRIVNALIRNHPALFQRNYSALTWFLPPLGIFMATNGHYEKATEILGLALTHHYRETMWADHWHKTTETLELLKAKLGQDRFETLWDASLKNTRLGLIYIQQDLDELYPNI